MTKTGYSKYEKWKKKLNYGCGEKNNRNVYTMESNNNASIAWQKIKIKKKERENEHRVLECLHSFIDHHIKLYFMGCNCIAMGHMIDTHVKCVLFMSRRWARRMRGTADCRMKCMRAESVGGFSVFFSLLLSTVWIYSKYGIFLRHSVLIGTRIC